MHYNFNRRGNLAADCCQRNLHSGEYQCLHSAKHIRGAVGMACRNTSIMSGIHSTQKLNHRRITNFSNNNSIRPHDKKVKVNLRRCLYEYDLSCARCWWLLYGNAEPGPGFPSCPAGSCGIRPDGPSVFYLGWPISDAPVLSGRIHGFQVVINYTNYHQKPAEIFVQITVINNLNSSGTRANIQTT